MAEPPKRTVVQQLNDQYVRGDLDTVTYLLELHALNDLDAPPAAMEVMTQKERRHRTTRVREYEPIMQLTQAGIIESRQAIELMIEQEKLVERQAEYRKLNSRVQELEHRNLMRS